MPFINTKYSQKITPEQETELKTALGVFHTRKNRELAHAGL